MGFRGWKKVKQESEGSIELTTTVEIGAQCFWALWEKSCRIHHRIIHLRPGRGEYFLMAPTLSWSKVAWECESSTLSEVHMPRLSLWTAEKPRTESKRVQVSPTLSGSSGLLKATAAANRCADSQGEIGPNVSKMFAFFKYHSLKSTWMVKGFQQKLTYQSDRLQLSYVSRVMELQLRFYLGSLPVKAYAFLY